MFENAINPLAKEESVVMIDRLQTDGQDELKDEVCEKNGPLQGDIWIPEWKKVKSPKFDDAQKKLKLFGSKCNKWGDSLKCGRLSFEGSLVGKSSIRPP